MRLVGGFLLSILIVALFMVVLAVAIVGLSKVTHPEPSIQLPTLSEVLP